MPSFFKGKSDPKLLQPRTLDTLKIDERVVTFDKGPPLRGTVRFTGDVEDSSGHVQIFVGLELVGSWSHGFTCDSFFLLTLAMIFIHDFHF